jgi:hypothetical protein
MSDNPQEPAPTNKEPQPEYLSRHEERMRRREERIAARGGRSGSSAWILGGILVVVGIVLMLQNFNLVLLNNWWALFILIPAIGAFAAAWRLYQNAGGHLTAPARSSLIGGLILTMITAIFLFNLNWTFLGPILIILLGVGVLVNTFLPS